MSSIKAALKEAKAPEKLPPEFSEEAFALDFAESHADNMRYVAKWGCWMIYRNGIWRRDETLQAFTRVRRITRAASSAAPDKRTATRIASGATVAAVEKLSRSDHRFAATTDQWDVDKMLLNTPGGTVDLRNGELVAHAPDDYLSKRTAITPANMECPLWMKFLDRATNQGKKLQDYLQRLGGYCLTGSVAEDVLNFIWGTGRNGKTVFLDTIEGIIGDYAITVGAEMFMESPFPRHTTELAQLMGKRLVLAQELSQGQKWNEARLKAMTGGGKEEARFMRQDNFTFERQYKVIISGNHKPGLSTVDPAWKSRMRMIPFTAYIPPGERDIELREKLKKEWPGILYWMIEGCLKWQDEGLRAPASVLAATDAYLAAEDTKGRWLEECCEIWTLACGIEREDFFGRSSVLFESWKHWCEQNNEYAGSNKALSQALVDRGFKREDKEFGAAFMGVKCTHAESKKMSLATRAGYQS